MSNYFLFFKDTDDYGYSSIEFGNEYDVIKWLDNNSTYDDVKVIYGRNLKVTKKHDLEEI